MMGNKAVEMGSRLAESWPGLDMYWALVNRRWEAVWEAASLIRNEARSEVQPEGWNEMTRSRRLITGR